MQIVERNRNRRFLMVQADGDNSEDIFIGTSKDVTAANGIRLEPGEMISFPNLSHLNANGFTLHGVHGGSNGADPKARIMEG